MRILLLILFNGFLTYFPFHSFAQQINSAASEVSFRIGNMRINTVNGTFSGMTGTVNFNPDNTNQSKFNVCINAASVNTGNRRRDDHLREADFFNVEQFPKICFESIAISKTSSGFIARGRLSLKGVTRIITIPFTQQGKTLIGIFTINRLDYNVGEGTGTFLVSNPVEVTIKCVLVP
jgi:polyisoprenoid-binding protein YceI